MKSLLIVGYLGLVAGVVYAGHPQPPAVMYGQIRNEYGHPMDTGAEVVVLDRSTATMNECGRYTLDGPILVGMNYRISIPLEDITPLLRPNATQSGNSGMVMVLVGGVEQPIVPDGAFVVPEPGSMLAFDFSIAQDVDGDGLPDAWEELMVAWSDGVFSSIEEIDPDADPDGDGMDNYHEYLAGTFPFLATDIFEITKSEVNPETGRIALTFLTVSTRKYHVLVRGGLNEGEWGMASVSAQEDGELEYQVFDGTGRSLTVYVDASLDASFFSVGAD